jgi:hypothetical protein
MAAKVLTWIALLSTIAFVALALGRNLHPELLAFPLIFLAVAQLLALQKK